MPGKPTRKKFKLNPLFLREKELREAKELLLFAYRNFTSESDQVLADFGFGHAHHRVIYFVAAKPGIIVGELLTLLQITKQSLSRVMNELLVGGFLYQKTDLIDRRRKKLFLTPKGESLENMLTEPQLEKIAQAFRHAGVDAVEGFCTVLQNFIDIQDETPIDHAIENSEQY